MSNPIRIVIADDHPLYRSSVARAVRQHPALELVAEAPGGREALTAIRSERPQVAVIDLQMPELDGIGVIDAIGTEALPTRVLLLTGTVDASAIYRALERGAGGVLTKLVEVPQLLDAILAVARGQTVIADEAQNAVAAEIRLRSRDARPVLSEREREILARMAEGDSIPAIAKLLHLSPSTIKSHVEQLYRKLDVSDRAAAVAAAMRRGLLR